MAKIGFSLVKIRRLESKFRAKAANPAYRRVFRQWGIRYLAWIKKEFVKNSRGSGAWKALSPRTIAGRRKGSGEGQVAILRDSGTLFRALTINQPGNLFEYLKRGVRVGFGGPSKHPKGKASIADIAKFHNTGKGKLPKRRIIHHPKKNPLLVAAMMRDLRRGVKSMMRSV